MKKVFMTVAMVMAFVATFMVGYNKGTEAPREVVDDFTIMETYISEEFGDSYRGELVVRDLTDNKVDFNVYTSSGIQLTSVSVARYSM